MLEVVLVFHSIQTAENMKIFSILCLCVVVAFAKKTYYGDQVLNIYPKHEHHVNLLKTLDNDFSNVKFLRPLMASQVKTDANVQVHFNAKVVADMKRLLSSNGIGYEVLIEDLQESFDEEMKEIEERRAFNERIGGFDYTNYHTWDEIEQWVSDITNDYSDLASSEVIGTSTEGRNMYMLTVTASRNPSTWLVMDCGFHAREWISPAFCLRFTHDLVTKYQSGDPDVLELLDSMAFKILPMFNPDGYDYSWTDDRMWRKTRSGPERGCYGTDPNRNFDAKWGGEGSSGLPCSETYRGKSVASAPETAAYQNYINANKDNIKGYMTVHSYSEFIIIPYSYSSNPADYYPPNFCEMDLVAGYIADAIYDKYRTVYAYSNGADGFYPAAGGSDDYSKLKDVALSYTIELRPCSNCVAGFQLPANQIEPTCDETYDGIITMAQYLLDTYVTGANAITFQDNDLTCVPDA